MHERDKAFPITFNIYSATIPKEKVQDKHFSGRMATQD